MYRKSLMVGVIVGVLFIIWLFSKLTLTYCTPCRRGLFGLSDRLGLDSVIISRDISDFLIASEIASDYSVYRSLNFPTGEVSLGTNYDAPSDQNAKQFTDGIEVNDSGTLIITGGVTGGVTNNELLIMAGGIVYRVSVSMDTKFYYRGGSGEWARTQIQNGSFVVVTALDTPPSYKAVTVSLVSKK